MMRIALTGMLALALAGCGKQVALSPKPGMAPVPKAAAASRTATAAELMTPSTQARPQRNVDILSRSEARADDPFDLAPSADNGRQ